MNPFPCCYESRSSKHGCVGLILLSVTKGYMSFLAVLYLLSFMVVLSFPELEKKILKCMWMDKRFPVARAQEIPTRIYK